MQSFPQSKRLQVFFLDKQNILLRSCQPALGVISSSFRCKINGKPMSIPRRRIFSRRNQPRRSFRLPIGLILVVLTIVLCVLIPSNPLNLANQKIPNGALPTALPTFTPPPQPTKEHLGRLIFTCTRGDYNFEGQRLLRLTNHIGNVVSPSFSPDGSRILFANRAAEGPTSLWTIDNTGKNADLLYAGPNTIVGADWAPVGNRIAFAMAVDQPDSYEVFIMNDDGTNVRQLTRGLPGIVGSLDWSPDGTHLLLYAGPPGDKNIFLVDVDAETAAQLTNGGNNAACSFSPDGQWIAFNSLRNNDQADIFIMRPDGSDLRQVTNDPEPDWQPQWEP